jgi:hypothetical protein
LEAQCRLGDIEHEYFREFPVRATTELDREPSFAIPGSGHWPINVPAREQDQRSHHAVMFFTVKPCSSVVGFNTLTMSAATFIVVAEDFFCARCAIC